MHEDLLLLLPQKLRQLQAVELVQCDDLLAEHVQVLAGSGAARRLVVDGCSSITDKDCMAIESSAAAVTIVYRA